MAESTAIEWTDATFNPWWGCQKVSPACDHCYAERDAKRFASNQVLWGVGAERRTFADKHWEEPFKWAKRAFVACPACGWRGMHTKLRHEGGYHRCPSCGNDEWRPARMRVFCASMADWLDLDAPLDQFVKLLRVIESTPELDWLLLSKRIGNWNKRMRQAVEMVDSRMSFVPRWAEDWLNGKPPANVWIGSTVVNQEEADRDIPKLLAVPARVRFLSIEPMLAAIDIRFAFADSGVLRCPKCMFGTNDPHHGPCPNDGDTLRSDPGVNWVICGGESGPNARPMQNEWAQSIVDQCKAAGVAAFVKQLSTGGPKPVKDIEAFPKGLRVREFPNA